MNYTHKKICDEVSYSNYKNKNLKTFFSHIIQEDKIRVFMASYF